MKKLFICTLFLGMVLANTSCSKDKQNNTINDFVRTYFPQTEVLASIMDGLDYDVTLKDYTQIGFDGNLFGKLEWDGKRVTNNEAANAFLRTTYRKGWELPSC